MGNYTDDEDIDYDGEGENEEDCDENDEENEEDQENVEDEDNEEDDENFLINIAEHIRQQQHEETERQNQDMPVISDIDIDDYDPDIDLDPQPDVDMPDFDELYELFHIHSSNERTFMNMSSNEYPFTNRYRYSNGYITNNMNTNDYDFICPICNETLHTIEAASHLVYEHSRLFVSLTSSFYPTASIDEIRNVISLVRPPSSQNISRSNSETNMRDIINRLIFSEDDDMNMPTYEDLLQLCDHLGYHKKGIENVDHVAPVFEAPYRELFIDQSDTCRICLEPLCSIETVRKINKCDHIFCASCIETWFKENKNCPLCKVSLDEEPTPETETNTERNEQTDASH